MYVIFRPGVHFDTYVFALFPPHESTFDLGHRRSEKDAVDIVMEKVNVVDSAAIIRHFTKDHSKLAYLRHCRDRVEPSFISSLSHSSKTKEAINHIISIPLVNPLHDA